MSLRSPEIPREPACNDNSTDSRQT